MPICNKRLLIFLPKPPDSMRYQQSPKANSWYYKYLRKQRENDKEKIYKTKPSRQKTCKQSQNNFPTRN